MPPDWPNPWRAVNFPGEADALIDQLQHELVEGHPLCGLPASPVARRDDTNDVLFELSDGRSAEVHLTYTKGPFTSMVPWAALYPDLGAFLTEAEERLNAPTISPAFLDPNHPMNRMPLASLSNPTSDRFAHPPDASVASDHENRPIDDLKHHLWHMLGSRLQGDGRCLVYDHPALVSASGILIATGFDVGYAVRVPQDVLDWALEAAIRVQGEKAGEFQDLAQSRLGPDWLVGAYLDHEIAWCRQMFNAIF